MDEAKYPTPSRWFCDTCGGVISSVKDGSLEYLRDPQDRAGDFKIIHAGAASPRKTVRELCRTPGYADFPLRNFVGHKGLAFILSMVDPGLSVQKNFEGAEVNDLRGWVEIVRRLFTPYYEEARRLRSLALEEEVIDGESDITEPEVARLVVKECGQEDRL